MSDFPLLKTGAVVQYPAERDTSFSTQVVRFIDGPEQRYRDFPTYLRRWVIRLEALDESEMAAMRNFFRTQSGAAGTFQFTDPWDGTSYPNCRLDNDHMIEQFTDVGLSRTTLTIKENRS